MAAKVPLNKFRNLLVTGISGVTTTNYTQMSAVYRGREERASIVIQAQATNPTFEEATVFLHLSANDRRYKVAEQILIPPYDTVNLIQGRLVIQGVDGASITTSDVLLYGASDPNIVLTLGLLETKNTD